MLTILFYLFTACICLDLLKYLVIYTPVTFKSDNTPKRDPHDLPPVSVIVYIKNQQDQLLEHLTSLLSQNYPVYQIVLVNNASCDDSLDILEQFVAVNPKVKLVNVVNNENFWNNKKYALTLGIKVALYDHFIFSQPQGQIQNEYWLVSLASYFTKKKEVVIGFTAINSVKNSFINKLIRYQNVVKTINLFSWTYFGKPLHGNALNQGYTKDLFYNNNGFIKQMKTPYGDQYAYINQIATAKNTAIATSKSSFTLQEVPNKTKFWLNNFKVHNLLFKTASFSQRLKQGVFAPLPVAIYISFVILLLTEFQWKVVLGLLLIRMVVQYFYYFKLLKKFNNKDLLWTLPLLEIIHTFIQTYYSIAQFLTRKKLEKTYS
ncbi:glycosyltransferase [Myroides sp. LJL119]